MSLSDCIGMNRSKTELLIVFSEAAYQAAKVGRDLMTQAVLKINGSYILEENLADVLDNDDCKSLMAALGVGIDLAGHFAFSQPLLDVTKLRYQKIIAVTQTGERERNAITGILRFFFRYMRPIIDDNHVFVAETPLKTTFTQNEFVEHILNPTTRRLRIVGTFEGGY